MPMRKRIRRSFGTRFVAASAGFLHSECDIDRAVHVRKLEHQAIAEALY